MVGRRTNGAQSTTPQTSSCSCDCEVASTSDNPKSRNNNCWRTANARKHTLCTTLRKLSLGQQLILACLVVASAIFTVHRTIVWYKCSKDWVFSPIMYLERPCPSPSYDLLTATPEGREAASKLKLCITTLTDEKTQHSLGISSWIRRIIRWRNYDNILEFTWASKQAYAKKHGYHLFDGSDLVQKGRPAQWSKIKAVQRLLTEEKCDWVLWHDADTLFVNTQKKMEDLLPANPDTSLLVAVDTPNPGYNSGSWLVKNSEWGNEFLQKWWDMKSFVRLPGQSLSGDNDAFKVLLASYAKDDFAQHVGVPPRCSINAFAKFLRPKEKESMTEEQLKAQPWYLSENYYHKGDWLVHVPGYDNKRGVLEMMMQEIH